MTHLLSSRLYCWFRSLTGSAIFVVRGLYRQWGISPRPEDIPFSCSDHIIAGVGEIAIENFRIFVRMRIDLGIKNG